MRDVNIAITAASYSGNKGAAAMLQSSISQLRARYGERLVVRLMSVYPAEDREQVPYDFVKIVSAKPEQLLFVAFPLAILYRLFRWLMPLRILLEQNDIIRAYKETDLVVDEAGISFVDERGFIMNTYAFVCAAVPLLVGTPVAKYSQALGTFKNGYNRFLAKWILPKLELICARGQITYDNLAGIGVTENVKLCADGAFSMQDDPSVARRVRERMAEDSFYDRDVVGLSISSVVEKKCHKLKIDYVGIMAEFIAYLNERGYNVLLLANAARLGSKGLRNNDLLLGDKLYAAIRAKEGVRWYHEEMQAEEIREYIGNCRFLVASRFHAMIGALEKRVPVLLVGWSHKYQEVLDMFGLGTYATDFSHLTLEGCAEGFKKLEANEQEVRRAIDSHYDEVIKSSRSNVEHISGIIDRLLTAPYEPGKALDYKDPDKYIGPYKALRKGYAADESIRRNAASGGMVTALLCHMLKRGDIDGAWVTKTRFLDGRLTHEAHIARTEAEIRDASTSVYMDVPQLRDLLPALRGFDGKVAVVLTPCMSHALTGMLEKEPELKKKVVMKLGLFCSGSYSPRANAFLLEKCGVDGTRARRFYFRQGHWRGPGKAVYQDGTEQSFSYTKIICAYKNAYFFEEEKCTHCKDHFAACSDISFGDIWNAEMKKHPIKHTCCVIRTDKAMEIFNRAVAEGDLLASSFSAKDMLRGQKRALVYKFLCAEYQSPRWNYRLVNWLAEKNRRFSREHQEALGRIPLVILFYYMCFMRALMTI